MDRGQPVTGKRMPEPVLRPARKPGVLPDPVQFPAGTRRNYPSGQAGVGPEPCGQVRLDRDNASTRALCLCRFHFDVSARKIDLVPVESLNLSFPKARERANG